MSLHRNFNYDEWQEIADALPIEDDELEEQIQDACENGPDNNEPITVELTEHEARRVDAIAAELGYGTPEAGAAE